MSCYFPDPELVEMSIALSADRLECTVKSFEKDCLAYPIGTLKQEWMQLHYLKPGFQFKNNFLDMKLSH